MRTQARGAAMWKQGEADLDVVNSTRADDSFVGIDLGRRREESSGDGNDFNYLLLGAAGHKSLSSILITSAVKPIVNLLQTQSVYMNTSCQA